MALDENVAQVKYVPPVKQPDYIEGTFSMIGVAEMLLWVEAVKVEFEMSAEVEAIFDGFKAAYQGELPGIETGAESTDDEGAAA